MAALLASRAAPPVRVAVVGGGVAASSFVHRLGGSGRLEVHLFEMGRGLGGRASTRRTRELPELRVDHGAPYLELLTPEGRAAVEALRGVGGFDPVPLEGHGALLADGSFAPADPGARFASSGGMATLCEALAGAGEGRVVPHFGTMVRSMERASGAWRLADRSGEALGDFEWLVVTGSGVAHPRWVETFGGEPPLAAAAAKLGDARLSAAVAAVGAQSATPVMVAMMAFEGPAAEAWASLPFTTAEVQGDDDLAKIVIGGGGLLTVVAHSTVAFAERAAGVHGSTSTAARVAGAATAGAAREAEVLGELLAALRRVLLRSGGGSGAAAAATLAAEGAAPPPAWGPHLHRWGNARPSGAPLPADAALSLGARVAFAGDFVATAAPMGSVEAALLSGFAAADAVLAAVGAEDAGGAADPK